VLRTASTSQSPVGDPLSRRSARRETWHPGGYRNLLPSLEPYHMFRAKPEVPAVRCPLNCFGLKKVADFAYPERNIDTFINYVNSKDFQAVIKRGADWYLVQCLAARLFGVIESHFRNLIYRMS
jgi:hypothetical protein